MQYRRLPMVIALLCVCAVQASAEETLWLGTIETPVSKLRILLRLDKQDDGQLTGAFGSIDQTNIENVMDSVDFTDGNLVFEVKQLRGSYKGTWEKEAKTIRGTWSQNGANLKLDLRKIDKPPTRRLEATWSGTLNAGGAKLLLVFRIFDDEGKKDALFNSPNQTAQDFPATVSTKGKSVSWQVKNLGASFEGKLNADATEAEGFWIQGGQRFPMKFDQNSVSTKRAAVEKRPQLPKEPFGYRVVDAEFENADADVTLSGTLTLPEDQGPHPAAILITGSGPQDRDETIAGHKPFLVLADHLTKAGIAVLRYDDRGVGESSGDFAIATSEDFATDVTAALHYLRQQEQVDSEKIGLIGHSEGGYIAPMVAAESKDVAFVVMLAGPGVNGAELLVHQLRLILEASGVPPEQIDSRCAVQREMVQCLRDLEDLSDATTRIEQICEQHFGPVADRTVSDAAQATNAKAAFTGIATPWFQYFFRHEPTESLRLVDCPVLALYGALDLQVDPKQNLEPVGEALTSGGNQDVELVELPSLNHLFQTARTGLPSEYGTIEESIAPVALDKIRDWIVTKTM